jgi:hypothetical protein
MTPPKGGVDKKEGQVEKWPQKGGEKGVKRLREVELGVGER